MGTLRGLRSYVTGLWSSMRNAKAAPASTLQVERILSVRDMIGCHITDDLTNFGPVHQCACGCEVFIVLAWFNDGEVAGYFTDSICSGCHSAVTIPTEADDD